MIFPGSVQLVFEPDSDSVDLFSADALKGMCKLADEVVQHTSHLGCTMKTHSDECCASRSIGTYVAHFAGRSSCSEIMQQDVDDFKTRLQSCAAAFERGELSLITRLFLNITDDTQSPSPPRAPPPASPPGTLYDCSEFNAVFDTYNALVDKEYLFNNQKARYVKLMLAQKGDDYTWIDIHNNWLQGKVGQTYGGAKLIAYDLLNGDVRYSLFAVYLNQFDMIMIVLGFFVIYLCIALYTGSFGVATLSYVQIFLAIGLAYGLYTCVLFLPFFPMIAVVGIFLLIGIGADDVFVIAQSFDDAIRARASSKRGIDDEVIKDVLYDGAGATLVTSFTTAGAFFATASSSVTAVRAFGIFCGLVVICDWVTMVFFLPSIAVLYSRYFITCCCTVQSANCPNIPMAANDRQLTRPAVGGLFDKCLGRLWTIPAGKVGPINVPAAVSVLALLALALGLGSVYMAKGLELPKPETADMALLLPSDPLEQYCCAGPQVKNEFTLGGLAFGHREFAIMFGAKPEDNGDHMDPKSFPTTQLQEGIDITSKAAQQFLYDLVRKAPSSSWWQTTPAPADIKTSPRWPWNNSFEVAFSLWEQPCSAGLSTSGVCCGLSRSSFPYEPSTYQTCLSELAVRSATQAADGKRVAAAGMTSETLFGRTTSGFSVWWADGKPVITTLLFPTKHLNTQAPKKVDKFWREVNEWTDAALKAAPKELNGGFATVLENGLDFYALNTALSESSKTSLWISLIIAAVVLLIFTRNAIVTVMTVSTVFLIMITVAGIVSLIGWEQGLIESIVISMGIGMACDFSAHIGFCYRQANMHGESTDRAALARLTVQRMVPALSAAAFSTGVMGVFMCLCKTLFTIKFGTFILLLMVFGWVFAVFFLVPLLALMGPLGNWGELSALCGSQGQTPSAVTVKQGSDDTKERSMTNRFRSGRITVPADGAATRHKAAHA